MNARALSTVGRIATRAIRPSSRCTVPRAPLQRRFASSEQQPSHISQFYKTFTRPVAKVLLMAFFTYQLAYWAWVKLEQDEIIAQREAYIQELEHEVNGLTTPSEHDPQALKQTERARSGKEPVLQDYQTQLMQLERRRKEVLAAREQAAKEEAQGQQTTTVQKTSSWWKVW